jgi:hypothetical protein
MDPIDALRDEHLDATAARERLERAAATMPRQAWRAILRDETLPRVVRRLVIRRLLEAEARPGATLAEIGAMVAADAWLQPTHARHVSVVIGKIPVQWLAEDRVVAIDVCPAAPGDGDRHRLLVYLRVAGQPEVEEIVEGLRGGPGGEHEVRELGFFETEAARPGPDPSAAARPPMLGALLMCRRALSDAQTGMHTLVDVIVDLPVQLPGPAMFDVYLQLRRITGPASLAIDVIGPGTTDDRDEVVLTTGTLTLGAAPDASPNATSGPPPPVLGVAIPNVVVAFERAGEHRLRLRCGDEILGEHRFQVTDEGAA